MYGFVGFTRIKEEIYKDTSVIRNMNSKLQKKEMDVEEYFINENINLGCRSKENKLTTIRENEADYTIIFNGRIYNKKEIKDNLKELGIEINDSSSDEEVLLKHFIHYGIDGLSKVNGVFSFVIWNDRKKEIYLARDHFGIKPLYYTIIDNTLVFSTEVKAILEYPGISAKINMEGICELIGIGPAHTLRNYSI